MSFKFIDSHPDNSWHILKSLYLDPSSKCGFLQDAPVGYTGEQLNQSMKPLVMLMTFSGAFLLMHLVKYLGNAEVSA